MNEYGKSKRISNVKSKVCSDRIKDERDKVVCHIRI